MPGSEVERRGLRDVQLALAARVTLLAAVLVPAFLAVHWTPVAGAGLAAGVLGSAAVTVATWGLLAPVVLQALALQGTVRGTVPRERASAALAIRRPEEPGRPGRARPRAPGVGAAPRPAG